MISDRTLPHAVYRHLNAAGDVLYVGCSVNPMARFNSHRSQSPWAPQVRRIDIEWFDNLEAALAEEQRQINQFAPPMNTQVNRKRPGSSFNAGPVVLNDWMLSNDLSVSDLARLLEVSVKSASNLMKRNAKPHNHRRIAVCKLTNGFVPDWVWTTSSEEAFKPRTPEQAAAEMDILKKRGAA